MIGTCWGAVLDGVEGTVILVEADVSGGLPRFSIVGLPDSAVTESKLRIRSAIRNAGLEFPSRRITVNLSPASLRKRGAGLDLAIAIAILRAAGQLPPASAAPIGFAAELGLSGHLVEVPGIINLGLAFRRNEIEGVVVAGRQRADCAPLPDLRWHPHASLSDVVSALRTDGMTAPTSEHASLSDQWRGLEESSGDFSELLGLEDVKRALCIAAAGRHHVMLVGAPGSGKTMIAERFPSILPRLLDLPALEVLAIHQAAGLSARYSRTPPLRAPHHTITAAGLVGGGHPLVAGEASLAHHGVLLLDELLEFTRNALESLREPLVHRHIRLSRAGRAAILPADFQLLATLNPCPCGRRGFGECRCMDAEVQRYWARLSGPWLDRIDIMVHVRPQAWRSGRQGDASATFRAQVETARGLLQSCATHEQEITGTMRDAAELRTPRNFDRQASSLLNQAGRELALSGRGLASIIAVARSVAALSGDDIVRGVHLEEALGLRSHARR